MTFDEFITMLQAMNDEKPFKVGAQLLFNSEGGFTLKELKTPAFLEFMKKIRDADSPDYD